MESAYADPQLLRDLGARGARFVHDLSVDVIVGAETAGVPLAASISLAAELPFAFVRKPGYRGHEIDEPPVRGADVAGRRVLLVDDAISTGSSVERFTNSLAGVGAEVAGVLDLAAANGLLEPALHELTVDAIVNRWTDDDPRWDALPVTADGQLALPLREACPVAGASTLADTATSRG
jgi:orotate phosphoribosyltransferase